MAGARSDRAAMMEALLPGISEVGKEEEATVDMAQFEEFVKEHGVLVEADDEDELTDSDAASGDAARGFAKSRQRRRETADPTKLRELLASCSLNENDTASLESSTSVEATASKGASTMMLGKERRRMSCDPGLLRARAAARRASQVDRRKTLGALSSVPEEGHSEYEASECSRDEEQSSSDVTQATNLDEMMPEDREDFFGIQQDISIAEKHDPIMLLQDERSSRSSLTWTADEARLAVQELRRQLRVEREVASNAEAERDELAKEIELAQEETASRIELIKNLEHQRDAALRRAHSAESRANLTEHKSSDTLSAALAAADAKCAIAENLASAASSRETNLRSTVNSLKARVAALEKVKITKEFAAKVRELADERDSLRSDLEKAQNERSIIVSGKENMKKPKVPIDPYRGLASDLGASLSPRRGPLRDDSNQQDTCRQS